MARAVADSPLVKTALHGADPNFGRILQAAGAAFGPRDPFVVDLEIQGRQVVSAGEAIAARRRTSWRRWRPRCASPRWTSR